MKKHTILDEKKIKRLNKVIARGKAKYTLYFALAILIGTGISKLFTNNFLPWLAFGAGVTFTFSLITGYLISFHVIKNARKELNDNQNEVANTTPESEKMTWFTIAIIAALLFAPLIFKKQIALGLENLRQNSKVELKIMDKESGKETKLIIPQGYILKKYNAGLLPSILGMEMNDLTLLAKLEDMKPVPLIYEDPMSKSGFRVMNSANIAVNKSNILIQIKNKKIENEEKFIQSFVSRANRQNTKIMQYNHDEIDFAFPENEFELLKINPNSTFGRQSKFATPTDIEFKNKVIIACTNTICGMIANIPETSMVIIAFHPIHIKEWKDIYKKSQDLLVSFISPNTL